MTTQAHPAPTGTSHRQCPAEGFRCAGDQDMGHMCNPSEDRALWLGVLIICIVFVLLAVHVWRALV